MKAVVLVLVLSALGCSDSRPVVTPAEHADAQDTVEKLQTAQALTRLDCAAHEAAVTAASWLALNAQAKKGVAIHLAIACADVGKPTTPRITVIDHQSGQRLASVGAFGYKLEPR